MQTDVKSAIYLENLMYKPKMEYMIASNGTTQAWSYLKTIADIKKGTYNFLTLT